MYTSNQTGNIPVSVNDIDATGPVVIPVTYHTVDTGQMNNDYINFTLIK